LGTAARRRRRIIIALAGWPLRAGLTGVAVAAAGSVAAGIDSLLGQRARLCTTAPLPRETEQAPLHHCGQATHYRRAGGG
jgi:hypothetical protein